MNKSNLLLIVSLFLIVSCNEMSQKKYSSENECITREMQKCNTDSCNGFAVRMCREDLSSLYTDSYLKKVEAKKIERKALQEEVVAKMREECPQLIESVKDKETLGEKPTLSEILTRADCESSGFKWNTYSSH